jgi:hypothetical protein
MSGFYAARNSADVKGAQVSDPQVTQIIIDLVG